MNRKKTSGQQNQSKGSGHSFGKLRFTQKTLAAIYEGIGRHPAERGGILGCDETGVISRFFLDVTAQCSSTAYTPNTQRLNKEIRCWKEQGIKFQGFVHSHPAALRRLSAADEDFAKEIMAAFKNLPYLALPLVMTEPDTGDYQLIPFVAVRNNKAPQKLDFQPADIETESPSQVPRQAQPTAVIQVSVERAASSVTPVSKSGQITYYGRFPSQARRLFDSLKVNMAERVELRTGSLSRNSDDFVGAAADAELANKYFQRVRTAYDLTLLNQSRLVIIGTGGAAALIRDCARAGVGEFVLIDPDEVTESNVGTQSADPKMIGVSKVEALATDIGSLNPASAVIAVQTKIESLDDDDVRSLCFRPIRACSADSPGRQGPMKRSGCKPKQTILLVLTDNFEAQARGHRLGLHLGLSTVCAQEYREGRGAEITFTVPGITPACHRCITSSRYKAHLTDGYRNDVTSAGAPIFAAQMLNAAIGHIVLAVAHHGTDHPRFGNLISRFGKRSLILLRMDPDFDAQMGWPAFAGPLVGATDPNAFMMLDSVFLPQGPDRGQSDSRPVCPDCGGSGDLRNCIGKFADTRHMPTHPPVQLTPQSCWYPRPRKRN